jgi:hypothetical protein
MTTVTIDLSVSKGNIKAMSTTQLISALTKGKQGAIIFICNDGYITVDSLSPNQFTLQKKGR